MNGELVSRVLVFLLAVYLPAAAIAESEQPLSERIPAALRDYARHGDVYLPGLTGEEVDDLIHGRPVVKISLDSRKHEDATTSAMGVVGYRVIDAPRLLVWLTAMGTASEPDARLTRATLSPRTGGSYTRYQHVNLPWPIRDRHWVIRCEKNVAVADTSGGRFWEHRWSLVPNGESLLQPALANGTISGLTPRELERSVYLPSNRGAWILSELGEDKTLVIAFFDGGLGGLFPDALVRSFTKMHLREGLNLVAEISTRVHLEYDEEPLIHDGFGRPISRRDVLRLVPDRSGRGQAVATDDTQA